MLVRRGVGEARASWRLRRKSSVGPDREKSMSVKAVKRLEQLLAARANASSAHCAGDKPKRKPPGF